MQQLAYAFVINHRSTFNQNVETNKKLHYLFLPFSKNMANLLKIVSFLVVTYNLSLCDRVFIHVATNTTNSWDSG